MKLATRKRIAILTGLALVALLAGGAWHVRNHLRFWWLFESLGTNAQGFPEYRHRQTGILMVRLPGGTFWMGAQSEDPEGRNYDPDARENEGPIHEVTLSPFLIGKYEVTQEQWKTVMRANPSCFQGWNIATTGVDAATLPVETISWNDIQAFERTTGLVLPTEAQWEHAARAGTSTPFSFGPVSDCDRQSCDPCPEADPFVWWCGNSQKRPHEVGTKQPNRFGLHDMHGNVWEWCEDVFDETFFTSPEAVGVDPVSLSGSENRVLRGGAWIMNAWNCRLAARVRHNPSDRLYAFGLRAAFPLH